MTVVCSVPFVIQNDSDCLNSKPKHSILNQHFLVSDFM